MRKAYAADWIMNKLESLHPDFYPQAGEEAPIVDGLPGINKLESGFLTKSDLLSLYHECGSFLHRGSLKSILSGEERSPNFGAIRAWLNKIVALLTAHQIQLIDPQLMIWVVMNAKHDGRVHANVMLQRDHPDDRAQFREPSK